MQTHKKESVLIMELSLGDLQVQANNSRLHSKQPLSSLPMFNLGKKLRTNSHTLTQNSMAVSFMKKTIPKTLSDFCHRAKTSIAQSLSQVSSSAIVVRGSTASVLVGKITEISGSLIRQTDIIILAAMQKS